MVKRQNDNASTGLGGEVLAPVYSQLTENFRNKQNCFELSDLGLHCLPSDLGSITLKCNRLCLMITFNFTTNDYD